MKINIWTWGSGGAFGRELGNLSNRARRNHTATSIIGLAEEIKVHLLIDVGAPCVETMIDNNITKVPDVLFITHAHVDHVSDFDKLANSRKRDFKILGKSFIPLPVVCTKECIDDPINGLKSKFSYLGDLIKWIPIPTFDVWYSIRALDGKLLPNNLVTREDIIFPIDFKALPVYHATHAPGACLFVFRFREPSKRIVVSGDFESIEKRIIDDPDLKDPDVILLDTNTIKAVGTNHTNWEQNKKLIACWATGNSTVLVLLNRLAGFEDYEQGYYKHVPTDTDWNEEIERFASPKNTKIKIAEDGKSYAV